MIDREAGWKYFLRESASLLVMAVVFGAGIGIALCAALATIAAVLVVARFVWLVWPA